MYAFGCGFSRNAQIRDNGSSVTFAVKLSPNIDVPPCPVCPGAKNKSDAILCVVLYICPSSPSCPIKIDNHIIHYRSVKSP